MDFQNQLLKQRISPGKPLARELSWVVLVEAFVHETGASMGGTQPREALLNFGGIGTGKGPQNNTHGPDSASPGVRPSDTVGGFSLAKPGVVGTQGEVAGAWYTGSCTGTAPR